MLSQKAAVGRECVTKPPLLGQNTKSGSVSRAAQPSWQAPSGCRKFVVLSTLQLLQMDVDAELASLPLMPSGGSGTCVDQYLRIISRTNDSVRVLDPTESPFGTLIRDLFRGQHRFVLDYAIAKDPGKWTVRVFDAHGGRFATYDFALKQAALKFQEYITGYRTQAHVENTLCDVTFGARLVKGEFRRTKYRGLGEIQLWEAVGLPNTSTSNSSTTLMSTTLLSLHTTSTSSTLLSAAVSSPRDEKGRTIVFHHNRSPLLVALLSDQGETSKGYTILRAKSRVPVSTHFYFLLALSCTCVN